MLNTKEFPDKAGRIFPPLINIEYGEVTLEDIEENNEMDFEFKITYEMEMREARKDIEVSSKSLPVFHQCLRILFEKSTLINLANQNANIKLSRSLKKYENIMWSQL